MSSEQSTGQALIPPSMANPKSGNGLAYAVTIAGDDRVHFTTTGVETLCNMALVTGGWATATAGTGDCTVCAGLARVRGLTV
jgi:hypothetical protein